MPKLPLVSARILIKFLKTKGFVVISQRGSHIKLENNLGQVVIVPNRKQIKKGTLKKGILNPIGISTEELIKFLKKGKK